MSDFESKKDFGMKDTNINITKKINPKLFSKLSKMEKNNQYVDLQTNINSLSKDVRLLIDYAENNIRKKLSNKDYQYFKLLKRSNFLLHRNKKKKFASILNILNNYIDLNQAKLEEIAKKREKYKKNKSKKLNTSRDYNIVNKRRINKSVINLRILPEVNSNFLDKSSGKKKPIRNNINMTQRSPINKNKKNKTTKNMKLFLTEKEEYKQIIPKTHYNKFNLSKKNININITDNSFIKKFPNIINNKSTKNFVDRKELKQSTDKMAYLIKEDNTEIKNKITYKKSEQNLQDWIMKSKMKFARWKFGISEIDKYFVDMKVFGKPEELELLRRKTFYDAFDELVDDINGKKEENNVKKIIEEYTRKEDDNSFDRLYKKGNKGYNSVVNMTDIFNNKNSKESKMIQDIKKRKYKEEKTRYLINQMLVENDLRMKDIKRSTDRLLENQSQYKNKSAIINYEDEFNILKTKKTKKKNDKNDEDSSKDEKLKI